MIDILFLIFFSAAWQAAAIFLAALLLLTLLGERLEARWRYLLWCIILLRLALPILPASPWGVWQADQSVTHQIPSHNTDRQTTESPLIDGPAFEENPSLHVVSWDDLPNETAFEPAQHLTKFGDMPFVPQEQSFETRESETFSPYVFEGPHKRVANELFPDNIVATLETVPKETPSQSSVEALVTESAVVRVWHDVKGTFFVLWVGGMIIFALRLVCGEVRLVRRSRFWQLANNPRLTALLDECRKLVRLRCKVEIFLAPGEIGAASTGFWRPRIILSETTAARLSQDELKMVLLHELTHIRRCDPVVQRAALLLSVIHWLNPVVWFVILRLQRDRELACDAAVLHILGSHRRKEYGMIILAFAELFSAHERLPGLVGVLQKQKGIARRIEMIAKYRKSKWHQSLLGATLITLVAAFGLTKAQQPRAEERPIEPAVVVENDTAEDEGNITENITKTPQEKEFRPFPLGTTNWIYRNGKGNYFGYYYCSQAKDKVVFVRAEEDEIFTFDCKQCLWKNEKTNETSLELFLIGKDGFYRLGQEFRDEQSRLNALSQRNKVDQRYRGLVTRTKLVAGKNDGMNDDYTFDFDQWQWRERQTGKLISPEEFRTIKNLNARIVDDTVPIVSNKYLITWKNRGKTILGRDLPRDETPYHCEPLDAPSPLPMNAEANLFQFYSQTRSFEEMGIDIKKTPYVRLGSEDMFFFENGQWQNETTGDVSSTFFVEGDFGLLLLNSTPGGGKTGQIGRLSIQAESEQGVYAYRNGRWLNLETGETTTRNAMEQDDSLILQINSIDYLGIGEKIRLSRLGRKISVLGPQPESMPDDHHGTISVLGQDDVLVFADGEWKNEKTGERWESRTFRSHWGTPLPVGKNQDETGTVGKLFFWGEYGVAGEGKHIRLSDRGMTIETSNSPFDEAESEPETEIMLQKDDVLVYENNTWFNQQTKEVYPFGTIVKSESGGLWRLEEAKFHRLNKLSSSGEGRYLVISKEGRHIEASSLPGPVIRVLVDVLQAMESSEE